MSPTPTRKLWTLPVLSRATCCNWALFEPCTGGRRGCRGACFDKRHSISLSYGRAAEALSEPTGRDSAFVLFNTNEAELLGLFPVSFAEDVLQQVDALP